MIGKILGGLIGFFTMGPIGAVLGVFVGHFFDMGRSNLNNRFNPEQKKRIEEAFFNALFPMLGHLAKSDGVVSKEEIQSTEELITRMGLSGDMRDKAIALFQTGKDTNYQLEEELADFNAVCGSYGDVKRIFIVYLITIALADGELHENEEQLLKAVSANIGFSNFAFNQLLGMVTAQMAFRQKASSSQSGYSYYRQSHQGQQQTHSAEHDLNLAYQALGVESSDTDATIKKAYRKLMSENHPDKLAGQGVPDEMVKLATERSQEIQSAYDVIKKSRK